MCYRPAHADQYQVFEIVHPDLLALLNLAPGDGAGQKRFSLRQLGPRLAEVELGALLTINQWIGQNRTKARQPAQISWVGRKRGTLLLGGLQPGPQV